MDEACIPKESDVKLCALDVNISSGSNKCEINSLDEQLEIERETINDHTNNTVENTTKRFIKESRIHLLPDSDDSFEIFLPKKNSNIRSISTQSLPSGKQKTKKITLKSRSCPYFSSKTVKSYFKPPSKTQEEKDLELAIERSLLDISGSGPSSIELSCDLEAGQINTKKRGSPLKLKNWTGKDPKKHNKTILQRRTPEDRNRIITQKVAIVLLDKKEVDDCSSFQREIELTSPLLEEKVDKNSKLWELSKLSVDFYISDFYVNSLQNFIELPSSSVFYGNALESNIETMALPSECTEMSGIKLEVTENGILSPGIAETNIIIKNEHSDDTTIQIPERANNFLTDIESLKIFSTDFFSFFNNKNCSDLHIQLEEEFIHGHKLILHIRCPKLLDDVNDLIQPNVIDLSQYSKNSAVVFLKYIYSGKTEGIYYLTHYEKRDFTILSKKYEVPFLENMLSSTIDLDDLYNQSTCSPPSEAREAPFIFKKETQNFSEDSNDLNRATNIAEVKGPAELSYNSDDTLPLNFTPKKESNSDISLSRPFSIFSKTIAEIFEQSFNSPVPVSHQHLPSLSKEENVNSEVIHIIDTPPLNKTLARTKSPRCSTAKRKLQIESNSPTIFINDASSSNSPVKEEVKLNSSLVISIDSDSNLGSEKELKSDNEERDFLNEEFNNCHSGNSQSTIIFSPESPVNSIGQYSPNKFNYENEPKSEIANVSVFSTNSIKYQSSPCFEIHTPNLSSTPISSRFVNSSVQNKFETPEEEYSLIIEDATPRPDYDGMTSTELKVELRKYGLSPIMSEHHATRLLHYVYDQLHPESSEQFTDPIPSTSMGNPTPFSSLCGNISKERYEEENPNDFIFDGNIFNKRVADKYPNDVDSRNLRQVIINFLKSNDLLHLSVIYYRPLLLNPFFKALKDHGVCCSIKELMESLDDLCVRYTIERSRKEKKIKKKKTIKKHKEHTN